MALSISAKVPINPPSLTPQRPTPSLQPNPSLHLTLPLVCNNNSSKLTTTSTRLRHRRTLISKAAEDASGESEEVKGEEKSEEESKTSEELGAEIKKALMERKAKEKEGSELLLSGVAEEIGEIEWPVFGKVLGITGVVLGVIAGSSIVLLTVNAVLAELSDKVFAGRGIQDFF